MTCITCMLFILKSGLYVQFLQTYSLSYETIVNISKVELQQSNYLVIPSFLVKESKIDFRNV